MKKSTENCTTKQIRFYSSHLCPRCFMVRRHLKQLTANNKNVVIEERDIMLYPREAIKAGVRMIPALEYEGVLISGFFLGKAAIDTFLQETVFQVYSNGTK